MNVTVNILEVASEMAHRELVLQVCIEKAISEDDSELEIVDTDVNNDLRYRKEYQDMFNEYYDKWYSFLLLLDDGLNKKNGI